MFYQDICYEKYSGDYVICTAQPRTFDIPKPKKKSSKIKVLLFLIKWHWKNRKWENCRQKRRAFERALMKEGVIYYGYKDI